MKYLNKHKLPEAFVRACINDPYSRGESDFSATSLAEPARATALIEMFKDDLEIDVSSRVASIIGQGAHSIAERAARPWLDICEKRFFATFHVDGKDYIVSAQVDLYETDSCILYDWKTTKAYAFSAKAGNGKKPEWIAQMSVGAEIMRRNNFEVKKTQIIAMLKDWNKREAGSPGMPETEVICVDLPMWDSSKTTQYIEDRIRAKIKARIDLPKCTSAETWGGRKCPDWCDASSVCDQYKQAIKSGVME
jgi:hypothetical protein